MTKHELRYELETLGLQIDLLYEMLTNRKTEPVEHLKQYVRVSQELIRLRNEV